jgi:hypothetical protein
MGDFRTLRGRVVSDLSVVTGAGHDTVLKRESVGCWRQQGRRNCDCWRDDNTVPHP